MISSLTEHTRKCLKFEYLGRIEYDFQKSHVTGSWDHKDSVSAKKVFKKIHACVPLKVHKHEIILNFCLTLIKSLYALRKFSKKISLLFLRYSPEFRCLNISAVTEHTRNQIFFERYPKIFSSKSSFWSY